MTREQWCTRIDRFLLGAGLIRAWSSHRYAAHVTRLPLLLLLALVRPVWGQSVQLQWEAPTLQAGQTLVGYSIARCPLAPSATACTCTPEMVANVPPTPTLYLDTPPTPGRYCYSVSAQGTVNGVASTSPLAQPPLVVTVGGPPFPGPKAVQAEGLVPRSAIQSLVADSVDSSNPTRFAAANAVDGDPLTFWHTPFTGTIPPYPHTLTLDLGQEWALAGARVWPRPDGGGGFVTQWRIEVSSDGATWTVAGTSTVRTLTTQPEAVRWPVRRTRYVRLVCMRGVSGQAFASIGEFQLLQGVAP